jgi:hypothetical protein
VESDQEGNGFQQAAQIQRPLDYLTMENEGEPKALHEMLNAIDKDLAWSYAAGNPADALLVPCRTCLTSCTTGCH